MLRKLRTTSKPRKALWVTTTHVLFFCVHILTLIPEEVIILHLGYKNHRQWRTKGTGIVNNPLKGTWRCVSSGFLWRDTQHSKIEDITQHLLQTLRFQVHISLQTISEFEASVCVLWPNFSFYLLGLNTKYISFSCLYERSEPWKLDLPPIKSLFILGPQCEYI